VPAQDRARPVIGHVFGPNPGGGTDG
jgi:hypothetical protein